MVKNLSGCPSPCEEAVIAVPLTLAIDAKYADGRRLDRRLCI